MATKTKKKEELLKPITRKLVKEEDSKKTVGELLKEAGEVSVKSEDVVEPEKVLSSSATETLSPISLTEEEKPVREVKTYEDLLGALGDIDRNFEGVTDADYYPENYVEDAMKSNIPDSLGLSKVEVPEIDEEKLRGEVEAEELLKTEEKKQAKTSEVETKKKEKEDEILSLKKNAESEKIEIGEIYDDYKASVESDAIKRGLARSSVAILSLENVEASRAKELSRLAENLTSSINQVETEISELQQDLETSLSNLDLELAVNINKELKSRIEELEKKKQEAIEFNNQVSKLEAEYQIKRGDKRDEAKALEEELIKKYEGVAREDKENQKLTQAINYFNTMDRLSAMRIITSNQELAQALGSKYFDLYYYFMRK